MGTWPVTQSYTVEEYLVKCVYTILTYSCRGPSKWFQGYTFFLLTPHKQDIKLHHHVTHNCSRLVLAVAYSSVGGKKPGWVRVYMWSFDSSGCSVHRPFSVACNWFVTALMTVITLSRRLWWSNHCGCLEELLPRRSHSHPDMNPEYESGQAWRIYRTEWSSPGCISAPWADEWLPAEKHCTKGQ